MKKLITVVFYLFTCICSYAQTEPNNNLEKSLIQMKFDFPELRYIKTNDKGAQYMDGYPQDGIGVFFYLKENKVIEECMICKSTDGFPRMWFDKMAKAFINNYPSALVKSSYSSKKFKFSTFSVLLLYVSEKGNNTAMIVYEYDTNVDSKINNIENWAGTGFALKDGYIVTNYHIIEDAQSIQIRGVKGDFTIKYQASVVASDKNNDLTLLKISGSNFNGFGIIPYKFKTTISDVGEDIFVLGYPLTTTMGEEIKLTTGVISSKTGFQGDVSLYQISAPVQPGNSGGPLFDGQGNIVGIVNAKHKGADNVGYAVKTSYLKNLIESTTNTSIIPNSNLIASKSLPEKVKSIDGFVFLIECSNSNINTKNTQSFTTTNYENSISIYNPKVNVVMTDRTDIIKVGITSKYTIIEIRANNKRNDGSFAGWVTIDKDTYISADSKHYKLIEAEGIEIAPNKTHYSYAGQTLTFKLYFEPMPQSTTEFNLIESQDSDWKWYGVQLK